MWSRGASVIFGQHIFYIVILGQYREWSISSLSHPRFVAACKFVCSSTYVVVMIGNQIIWTRYVMIKNRYLGRVFLLWPFFHSKVWFQQIVFCWIYFLPLIPWPWKKAFTVSSFHFFCTPDFCFNTMNISLGFFCTVFQSKFVIILQPLDSSAYTFVLLLDFSFFKSRWT